MAQLNFHTLFDNSVGDPSYLSNITLTPHDKESLRSARTKIRAHLRQYLTGKVLKLNGMSLTLAKPRFVTQGSWAYKTINCPNRPPIQQADLDDGIYFPFSYVEQLPPAQMSKSLFLLTETLLRELAEQEGWKFIDRNPNCSRLEISADKHIDLPIYSIPDQEFIQLTEAKAAALRTSAEALYASTELDDDWEVLPKEGVMLANKDEGWIYSDPRPIKDWVESRVERKGEQLRRIIRYIKGWRDEEHWPNGDPKSILLMVVVDMCFDSQKPGRDDLALLDVVKKMPTTLAGQVLNPTDKSNTQDLTERLDIDGIRDDLRHRLERLYLELKKAINECGEPVTACIIFNSHFGDRFPNDPSRVSIATVQATKARKVESVPLVGTCISG